MARLIPIHSLKYLEVLHDEHMSWNEQIYQINVHTKTRNELEPSRMSRNQLEQARTKLSC